MEFTIIAARSFSFTALADSVRSPGEPQPFYFHGWLGTVQNPDGAVSFVSRLHGERLWFVDCYMRPDAVTEWDHPFGSRAGHTLHPASRALSSALNRRIPALFGRDRREFLHAVTIRSRLD
ncbi:hypothetical protein KO481_16930 [Nocardia sp. NEAU-G5]|uniref:Uncharacterized protein n=1 Tax=Nocardia albiluteola TaxID=2842303 RepID=A0ABS6B177_9NOCA|nr:hypothetical protein [Nocardia albiluteola]MBU3063206.1 hypothetical protein [Nocardia albiluteola]